MQRKTMVTAMKNERIDHIANHNNDITELTDREIEQLEGGLVSWVVVAGALVGALAGAYLVYDRCSR
jgi:lactobin A/cerein 7B family class IIb bacteriocin